VQLEHVIEGSEPSEVLERARCEASDFIQASLQAAKNSNALTRANILTDISAMLGCQARDLEFLFRSETDTPQGTIYKLDLPDTRLRSSDIYLEAAE